VSHYTESQYEMFWLGELPGARRTGPHEIRCACPVHGGDSPETLLVHLDTGFAHCFKCHGDGEAWSMQDFVRARYGMDAQGAREYVRAAIGEIETSAVAPWNYPFPKPVAITDRDWTLGLLAKRIQYFEEKHKARAYAIYPYGEIKSLKLRLKDALGKKYLVWLALTDKGGWSTPRKLQRDPPPYRAHTLANASEVWLLNGEKAVDRAVAEWGVTATCLPNGEAKWKDAYLSWFLTAGTVYLVTDNDPTGGAHGLMVGALLTQAAIETRIVALPGLPEKGDLWDWMEAGHTLEETREIASSAPLADASYQRNGHPPRERPPAAPPGDGAPVEGPDLTGYPNNDHGNCERLIAYADGNLLFCPERKCWLMWTGSSWQMDGSHAGGPRDTTVYGYAVRAMQLLRKQANQQDDEALAKWAYRCCNRGALDNMIHLASTRIVVRAEALDTHRFLVPCVNGTLDLRTGLMREHRREDFITRLYPYEYNPALGPPMLFLQTAFELYGGSPEADIGTLDRAERQLDYVRSIFGYCLTGDTSEKAFFNFFGASGNNGKTLMVATLEEISGPYAVRVDARLVTASKNYGDSNRKSDTAQMMGARVALMSELPDGEKFDQGVVKGLTQGDSTVAASFKHKDTFYYLPTAKLVLETNSMPRWNVADPAFTRRMHVIEHQVEIPEERIDRHLRSKLRREYPAIFTWAAERAIEVVARGLERPVEMRGAVDALETENLDNDGLGGFLEDCFHFSEESTCALAEIEQALEIYREKHRAAPVYGRVLLSKRLCLRPGIRRIDQTGKRKGPVWLRGLAPKVDMTVAVAARSGRDAQYRDD